MFAQSPIGPSVYLDDWEHHPTPPYRNFTPEGHYFLFESPDAALQFGFKLIDSWKRRWQALPAAETAPPLPIRLGRD